MFEVERRVSPNEKLLRNLETVQGTGYTKKKAKKVYHKFSQHVEKIFCYKIFFFIVFNLRKHISLTEFYRT